MAFLQEYTMLEELGKGGFATVYKVRHNELSYIRAIRVLNETIVDTSSKTYQKFLRECKVLLRLGNGSHPNIVHIYQPRLLDNKALVEMDYVDGWDLDHYLKQEKNFIPVEEVIRMATQIGSALAYCHEDIYRFCMDRDLDHLQDDPNDGSKVLMDEPTRCRLIDKYKVIHNDLHSGNIMRRESGDFVLLDFGLAINGDEVVRSSRHTNGAPEFKAPEKWDDESVLSEQSDIYSFGIVMFQYLAGRTPFPYNTSVSGHIAEYQIAEAHQKTTPPSIAEIRQSFFEKKNRGKVYTKDYPQWLEEMILKCLNKKPAERFRNGKELYNFIIKHIAKTEASQSVPISKTALQPSARVEIPATPDPIWKSKMDQLYKANISLKQQLNAQHQWLEESRKSNQMMSSKIANLQNILNSQSTQLGKQRNSRMIIRFLLVLLIVVGVCGAFLVWYGLSSSFDSADSVNRLKSEVEAVQEKLLEKSKENEQLKSTVRQKDDIIEKKNKQIEEKNRKIREQERRLSSSPRYW